MLSSIVSCLEVKSALQSFESVREHSSVAAEGGCAPYKFIICIALPRSPENRHCHQSQLN